MFFSNISYLPVCFLVICSLKYSFVWNDMYLFTGIHLFGGVIVCWYVLFILFFFLLSFCCCCCCCYWWDGGWGGGRQGSEGLQDYVCVCVGGGGGTVLLVEIVIDSYETDKKKGQNKQKKTEKHVNDTVVAVLITRNILSTSIIKCFRACALLIARDILNTSSGFYVPVHWQVLRVCSWHSGKFQTSPWRSSTSVFTTVWRRRSTFLVLSLLRWMPWEMMTGRV